MSMVSAGFNEDGIEQFVELVLSRTEAAAYVGISESGIRDAEQRGLLHTTDLQGQSWIDPDDLDAWKWRASGPSRAKKNSILSKAAKTRVREARERDRLTAKRRAQEELDEEARGRALRAAWEQESNLRQEVATKNEAAKQAFLRDHLDEGTTARMLGVDFTRRRTELRALERQGVIRRAETPHERVVVIGEYGAPLVEGEGYPMYISGRPFYVRADVLAERDRKLDIEERDARAIAHAERRRSGVASDDLRNALTALIVLAYGKGPKGPGGL